MEQLNNNTSLSVQNITQQHVPSVKSLIALAKLRNQVRKVINQTGEASVFKDGKLIKKRNYYSLADLNRIEEHIFKSGFLFSYNSIPERNEVTATIYYSEDIAKAMQTKNEEPIEDVKNTSPEVMFVLKMGIANCNNYNASNDKGVPFGAEMQGRGSCHTYARRYLKIWFLDLPMHDIIEEEDFEHGKQRRSTKTSYVTPQSTEDIIADLKRQGCTVQRATTVYPEKPKPEPSQQENLNARLTKASIKLMLIPGASHIVDNITAVLKTTDDTEKQKVLDEAIDFFNKHKVTNATTNNP